tara:strand:+ start:158 stop:1840 length:1683 start_codon:yes stop_codon:yes gene_type:complete
MSERPTTNVRYLRGQSLDQEQTLFANYYKDLIENFGIESTYFRHDTKFPNSLDTTPSGLGVENLIYGENTDPNYFLSGGMDIYIEVENDVFEMSKYGITPNENITIYFSVGEFNSKFASRLGNVTTLTKRNTFTKTISSTEASGFQQTLTVPFTVSGDFTGSSFLSSNGVLSGNAEISMLSLNASAFTETVSTINFPAGDYQNNSYITRPPGSFPSSTILSPATLSLNTSAGYKLAINPYIKQSGYYSAVSGDVDFVGTGAGTLSFTRQSQLGNYTTAASTISITGDMNVSVDYYNTQSSSVYENAITPQVGDFFRMDFFDDNHEEFEITNVYYDQLISDGISPLLGTYIWKCQAVRRIPSHETVSGVTNNEEKVSDLEEIQNLESYALENIADTINEYSGEDDVYGGYENSNSPFVNELTPSATQSAGKIFTFDQGPSYLYTDSINLFFKDKNSSVTNITDIPGSSVANVPDGQIHIEMMKSDGEDLYFINTNSQSVKLTNNFREDTHLNAVVNLNSPYFTKSHTTSGTYMTLERGLFLFSDGTNLFCLNEDLESTNLT